MTKESFMRHEPESDEHAADPFILPAEAPFFDSALNAWVLTRYADVLAALREPRLCQVGPRSKHKAEAHNEAAQLRKRTEVLAAMSQSKVAEWQGQIESLTTSRIERLPMERSIDLVREFIRPWSVRVTLIVNGFNPFQNHLLGNLAPYLPGGETDCNCFILRSRAAAATAGLKSSFKKGIIPICNSAFLVLSQMLRRSIVTTSSAVRQKAAKAEFEQLNQNGAIPLGKSVFLGTSQTLPSFLANAWLALLRHPAELARLRAQPNLMPRAIEELLRYAGIVHTLFRQASAETDLGGARILEGERVILKLASANRDPTQFPDPDCLDLTRRIAGQLALGAGPHSCVAGLLVRMAATVATSAFVERVPVANLSGTVDWYSDSTVRSPASLKVRLLGKASHERRSAIAVTAGRPPQTQD